MDILTIILLIIGFVLLIKGADMFVDGASDLATKLKIPAMIIGLTIVAFGTSAPEAAVSVTSALNHSNAIAISNIVGSNIFNLLVVVGITAIIYKIDIDDVSLKQDFPVLLISSILLLLFIVTSSQISRIEGIIFLIGIIAYVALLIVKSKKESKNMPVGTTHLSNIMIVLFIIVGLAFILIGSDLVVDASKDIALSLGMSETLVGLTIVSIGTSLPELMTSVTAAYNKNTGIAIGNAVGSCIFNILFIVGLTTTITPIATTNVMVIDTIIMILALIITYILAYDKKDFNRKDGIILVSLFIVYMIYIIIRN
ncbi:calcium/sodium antiporter [Candidatus Methanosphaera massiliense]|jgi:cation:H+ antiporter|uniref:calcium/sodium antiporter n=1 Tax=Methanosphaera TaxID=2316 RepID=UPI00238095AA|nr:calcium/sodium antiporter [Candidatus Methanosphaera massiliense]MDD6286095.1 calcium/sodium antiporter [Methanobacteriaceae archaeon]MDE4077740.1 calcium/sodium antiporter [Candidatus Methanosphaera massiliense]MDY2745382.1 calcium/sodium antiporter [Methanosphaera sp.]